MLLAVHLNSSKHISLILLNKPSYAIAVEDNTRNHTLFQQLQEMLLSCQNTYITSFLFIHECIKRMQVSPDNLRIAIHVAIRPSAKHSGQYNLPQGSEVAILKPNVVAEDEARQLISSYHHNEEFLKIIIDTHCSYDHLAHPLLYPLGTDGWSLIYLHGIGKLTLKNSWPIILQ
jgi:hypothetical protein